MTYLLLIDNSYLETQVIWVDRRIGRCGFFFFFLCCCDERSPRAKNPPTTNHFISSTFWSLVFSYFLPCSDISHFVLDMSMKMTALVNTVNILTTNEEFTFANEEKSAWWPP